MANIRIKDLSTTAAVTASDDFIAVDGATNGTRKLNAYSPTFGGNLTVSGSANLTSSLLNSFIYDGAGWVWTSTGTGAGTVKGAIYAAGGLLHLTANSSLATNRFSLNSSGDATLAGNLTVSGTGTSSFAGQLSVSNTSSPRINFSDQGVRDWYVGAQTGSDRLVFGTSVTSSGGHGIRIDSSLNVTIPNGNLTVSGGTITSGSGTLTLNSSANTVVLQSAGTTALTLDSSQNATFAGDIRFSLANTFDIGQTGTRVRNAFIRTLVLTSNAPAAANSTGTAGSVTWDANYLYVCTATDTWKRVAIATW